MPPRINDEWSDSEDENPSEIETSVLLGVPDGEIEDHSDLMDPAVSRIGGPPVFLPTNALAISSSQCKSCSYPMPLLAQMWCPFEGSAMDRVLYVWGCDRSDCQRKAGSVRAWRGFKFNQKYAAKLEKQKARRAAKAARLAAESAKRAEEKRARSSNPFSMGGAAESTAFGFGTQLFGGEPPKTAEEEEKGSVSESDSEDDLSNDEADIVAKQLESVSIQTSDGLPVWASCPRYKPVYLSTVSEYLSPLPKSQKQSQGPVMEDDTDDKRTASKDWGLEGWEASADVDPVFERFVRRVSNDNEQCVRYDLKGTPLPFGSRDSVYDRLFPASPKPAFTTKPAFAAPPDRGRTFDPSTIEKCEACGGRRVFECQLMPNLINVLQKPENDDPNPNGGVEKNRERTSNQTTEDRKRELERAMKAGIEWGTCLIFSCADDCCAEGSEDYREEVVLVQWDT